MIGCFCGRGGGADETSTTFLLEQPGVREINGSPPPSPATVPVPAPPSLSVQAFPYPSVSVRLSPEKSSYGKSCMQPQAPPVAQGDYDN